MINIDINYL